MDGIGNSTLEEQQMQAQPLLVEAYPALCHPLQTTDQFQSIHLGCMSLGNREGAHSVSASNPHCDQFVTSRSQGSECLETTAGIRAVPSLCSGPP